MIIYLIGMMGSGKTTIGKHLADRLQFKWVDLDQLIEKESGLSTHEYIQKFGIDKFRDRETEALESHTEPGSVISCGGGVVINPNHRHWMRNHGVVIYLQCDIDTLVKRLEPTNLAMRPLLMGDDLKTRLTALYDSRKALYEEASHYTISCDEKTIDEIVEEIVILISHLQKNEIMLDQKIK